jgi:fatty acyl-CoA reductase
LHEDLPRIAGDPEEQVKTILLMDPAILERETPKFVGHYPNTYAYTKALTELILSRRKGNVHVSIVRPSIIGCAWKGKAIPISLKTDQQ